MKRRTFSLITLATLCLLLFSLYLNFMYKGSNPEFTPVKRNTTDTTAHTAYMYQGTKDALVKN